MTQNLDVYAQKEKKDDRVFIRIPHNEKVYLIKKAQEVNTPLSQFLINCTHKYLESQNGFNDPFLGVGALPQINHALLVLQNTDKLRGLNIDIFGKSTRYKPPTVLRKWIYLLIQVRKIILKLPQYREEK